VPAAVTAPTTADLMAELTALRAEVAALHGAPEAPVHARVRVRKVPGRVRVAVTALESDPMVQYRVHRWGAVYWLANFPVFVYLFFWQRSFWDTAGVFVILMYSLYANLATDYGAMSAALAAQGRPPPPQIPLEEN